LEKRAVALSKIKLFGVDLPATSWASLLQTLCFFFFFQKKKKKNLLVVLNAIEIAMSVTRKLNQVKLESSW
jgi:hypothetical protein